jgi:ketosteroid isomerase-like protein
MKMTRNSLVIMAALCLSLTSCQPKKAANDTEKDKKAITEWNDKGLAMAKNLNKDNAETFVKYMYSEDAILFPPNAKSIKGLEAIIVFYQNYPPMSDFNQVIDEMEIFGDYAYLRLNWSIPVTQTGLNPYIDSGVIFCIMRKQIDGNWKIWREIWNSDLSVPGKP